MVVDGFASVDLVVDAAALGSVLFEVALAVDFGSVVFDAAATVVVGLGFVALVGFIVLAAGFFAGDAVGRVESNFAGVVD